MTFICHYILSMFKITRSNDLGIFHENPSRGVLITKSLFEYQMVKTNEKLNIDIK